MTILEAMRDPNLLGSSLRDPESWQAWEDFLAALLGLPTEPIREAWLIVGRRGGKSRIAALGAVYLACFRDYGDILAPDEIGTLPIVAADRLQARTTVMGYVNGPPGRALRSSSSSWWRRRRSP